MLNSLYYNINFNLVKSQQTRQMLKRIIDFCLSRLLNQAISQKSVSRVQSVALLLTVNRYLENQGFSKVKY